MIAANLRWRRGSPSAGRLAVVLMQLLFRSGTANNA